MMKNIYKITAALLLCALLLSVTGCENGAPAATEASETLPEESTAAPEIPASAKLVQDGKVTARIVRGANASQTEINAAVNIRKTLLSLYPDSDVTIADDFAKDGKYDSETAEILVGMTAYPETAAVLNSLPYGNAVLRTVGHKLIVASWSDTAYNVLADALFAAIAQKPDKNNVEFTAADDVQKTVNASMNAIPVVQNAIPDIVCASGDKAYQLCFGNADAGMLESYLSALQAGGFVCKQDRTVGENRFTSHIGKDVSVTAYYTAANRTMRVITEPASNYCDTQKQEYTAVTTPMFTMIGRHFSTTGTYLGYDANDGLMCMMLRLSDGRFIVVDGGVSDNGISSYATALYAKMQEQAPDAKNIHIAAWYLTHSHSDHVGGFKSFLAAYGNVVTIENILYNFPSDADTESACDESLASMNAFRAAISTYCPKVPVYKIHTGQQMYFADALVEIYYTQEDFVAKKRTISSVTNNWNNTSAIFSVDIAGQRIMFLGDAQETANNMTAQIFGSYLKSDIVQIAHHGGIGGTRAIYTAVDADVGLFTTSDELTQVYINKWDYNYHAVANLHMKEYFNSDKRITTFRLPYTPKSTTLPAVFVKTTTN